MADKEYESKIKLTADTAGAKETAREIDKVGESAKKAAQQTDGVGKAAKETASTAKSAFAGIGTAIGSATKAFHAFTRALGFIGLAIRTVEMLVEGFQKLRDWINRDEIAAAKLREEIAKREYEESVARVARNYETLNQQVAENLRLEQQKNALLDERTRMERNAEDAQLRLDKAKEIAALDQNDPDYGNKVSLINQKYARKQADLQEQRATEDNKNEIDRLYAAAKEKDKEAAELRKQIGWGSDAKRNLIEKRAEYSETAAAASQGDEKAKERLEAAKKEYEAAEAAYDKIKAAAEAAEKAAKELREQAANKTGANLAAKINNQAAQVEIDTQGKLTQQSIERDRKNREEQAKREKERKDKEAAEAAKKKSQADFDAATIADAPGLLAALKGNITDVESQMDAARAKEAKEKRDAWEAQNNLDLFNLNHSGRRLSRSDQQEQQRLTEAVQKETDEAQNASFELERTLKQLSGVLQGFTQQMKQVQREADAAQKRASASQAESPSGT